MAVQASGMAARKRSNMVTIRFTEAEVAMLKALADAQGLSQSDVVRQFVRSAFAELAQAKPTKPTQKRK